MSLDYQSEGCATVDPRVMEEIRRLRGRNSVGIRDRAVGVGLVAGYTTLQIVNLVYQVGKAGVILAAGRVPLWGDPDTRERSFPGFDPGRRWFVRGG